MYYLPWNTWLCQHSTTSYWLKSRKRNTFFITYRSCPNSGHICEGTVRYFEKLINGICNIYIFQFRLVAAPLEAPKALYGRGGGGFYPLLSPLTFKNSYEHLTVLQEDSLNRTTISVLQIVKFFATHDRQIGILLLLL